MAKMKIYYCATIDTEKPENDVFDEYPEKINCDTKKGSITLVKDTIESGASDIEYGEG